MYLYLRTCGRETVRRLHSHLGRPGVAGLPGRPHSPQLVPARGAGAQLPRVVQADKPAGLAGAAHGRHEARGLALRTLTLVVGQQLEVQPLRVDHALQGSRVRRPRARARPARAAVGAGRVNAQGPPPGRRRKQKGPGPDHARGKPLSHDGTATPANRASPQETAPGPPPHLAPDAV